MQIYIAHTKLGRDMCVGHHLHKICSCFDCMKNFPCSSSWSAWELPLIQRRLPCDKLMQISWVMRRMVRAAKRVCGLWGHPRGVVLQEKIDNQSPATSSSHPQSTKIGESSTHSPPTSSPAWALLPGDRQSPERFTSQNMTPPSSVPTTLQWWWKWWGTLAYVGL